MAIRVQDMGELTFGGLVTAAKWWDKQRENQGKITSKDILKRYSLWAYLVPGGAATIMSAFGVWRRQEAWNEHISHGFIYGFPQFLLDVVDAMKETGTSSSAVREANRIVQDRAHAAKQLVAGKTARSYQPEFQEVVAF